MEIHEIGRMVYTLRTEKKISQEQLCCGICSVATLSRLETGERRLDILIFNALLQRLGKSTDHINIVLTLEEFEYFVKRRNIEISLSTKDFEQAEKELELLETELLEKGISMQRQDIYQLHALLYIQKENNDEIAGEYIHKALLETIMDIDILKKYPDNLINNVWLSESELHLLLLYVYIRERIGEDETTLLESIIGYIRSKIVDEKAQNKELAKALHMQAYLYKQKQLWKKCYKCCEAIIEVEIKNGTMAILHQALEMEMECLKNGVMAQNSELRKKEYQCLNGVIKEYGQGVHLRNLAFSLDNLSQEKGLIDEVVRFSRLREGYSQEELSDGICSPETLSRIETGKNSPTIKKFYAIMEKLGVGIGYYNTEFNVKRFETLQKVNKLNHFNILKKYEEAEKILKEIEMEVDIEKNKQQLGLYHVVFDYRLGKIALEDALKRVEKLLDMSLKKVDGKYELPFQLSSTEISLLNQIAVYYRNMNLQKEAVQILKLLYECFQQSKLEAPERSQKYFIVVGNLASYLEESDELEEAIQLSNESLAASIKYNIGSRIGHNLIVKAYSQERIRDKKCLDNYEKAYYLCGLFEDFRNQNAVKKHVLDNWQIRY